MLLASAVFIKAVTQKNYMCFKSKVPYPAVVAWVAKALVFYSVNSSLIDATGGSNPLYGVLIVQIERL